MGYFQIIKEAIRVSNKNLAAILAQIIAWVTVGAVAVIFIAGLVVMAAGSLPGPSLQNFSAQNFENLLTASLSLIAAAVVMGLILAVMATLVMAFLHAGMLGCIIKTVRGEIRGFTTTVFFSSGRGSMFPMIWLYLIWALICLGVVAAFLIVGAVGIGGVLMPMKEAGNRLMAFGFGVPFLVVLILAGLTSVILLSAAWMFSMVAIIAARSGAVEAIRACLKFINEHFWDSILFTMTVFAAAFAANMVTQVISLPFSMASDNGSMAALGLLPLLIIASLLQMYFSLVMFSCFCVFYLDRTGPPAVQEPLQAQTASPPAETPAAPAESPGGSDAELLDAEILDEPDNPERGEYPPYTSG